LPLFEYTGYDAQGRKASGTIDGPGRKAATQALREQGIFPTELKESAGPRKRGGLRFGRGRVPASELAAATRQLATLLAAGLAIDDALATVAEQIEQQLLHRILARLREDVRQGNALHVALARHPAVFPDLYVSIVQVGEDSGTLDQAMHRLADFLEARARIRARAQAALAYPVLMAFVGIGVLAFLFAFVVPKITRMLEDMGQDLPWPTQLLITLNSLLSSYWWLLLIVAVGAAFFLTRYRQSAAGRLHLDRLQLKAPLFGKLLLLIITARLARTLATLLSNGVPLLKALAITRTLTSNRLLNQALATASQRVQEGGSLAAALRESALFPPMLAQLVSAGEKSGQLEDMLYRVADSYEHQTDLSITGMLSLLEPLMILVMGCLVGFVVLAILLPIFEASQGFG
jgi:general secretion pathway protein F